MDLDALLRRDDQVTAIGAIAALTEDVVAAAQARLALRAALAVAAAMPWIEQHRGADRRLAYALSVGDDYTRGVGAGDSRQDDAR